jgi:hypothetical protein
MGLFSFIETFFFISLGITFILILLLVYHFRQRFITLEQKCDTMFELINNIVIELNNDSRRKQVYVAEPHQTMFQPETMNTQLSVVHNHDSQSENDESCSDEEDSNSGDEADTTDSEYDYSDEDEDGVILPETSDDASVKIIVLEQQKLGELTEVPNDTDYVSDNDNECSEDGIDLDATEDVKVEKLELNHLDNVSKQLTPEENASEVYRKMSVQALKALVITKGLCSDPSKMKKAELVKMMETSDAM